MVVYYMYSWLLNVDKNNILFEMEKFVRNILLQAVISRILFSIQSKILAIIIIRYEIVAHAWLSNSRVNSLTLTSL